MEIITRNLKGLHSFRGVGFVELSGNCVPVCGSKQINCGYGSEVRWCDAQLIQVPAETETEATKQCIVTGNTTDGAAIFSDANTGRPILHIGTFEGFNLGGQRSGTKYIVTPPFKITALLYVGLSARDAIYPYYDPNVDNDDGVVYLSVVR